MRCKYPDKYCTDRYRSESKGVCCRLAEWKRKIKACPYDHRIVSGHARKRKKDKYQRTVQDTIDETTKFLKTREIE